MSTTAAKPTGAESRLIVPVAAFEALQKHARSRRLAAPPALILDITLREHGIFFAALIPSKDYEQVKTLYLPTPTFERLKYVQTRLNQSMFNFTLMDIVVANLIILRLMKASEEDELIGSVQGRGISSVTPGDVLGHYDMQTDLPGLMSANVRA